MTTSLEAPEPVQPLLRHAAFLGRVESEDSEDPQGLLGQGAFLVLRLVDLVAPARRADTPDDAFAYQHAATERFCRELAGDLPETAHLCALVRGAHGAFTTGRVRLVTPALFAYADHLENEGHYDEALDVLATLREVGGDAVPAAERIQAELRVARVNRKMARFEEAERWYARAGEGAEAAGETYLELLSRIGRANIAFDHGNYPAAETAYRQVIAAARAGAHADAEARAVHGLGNTLDMIGQPVDAAPLLWNAFTLYQDEASKCRTLGDLGIVMRRLGYPISAEQAFHEVLRRAPHADSSTHALLELMECASARLDRVAFKRWTESVRVREAAMTPAMRSDLYLKRGVGHARFGLFDRARADLATAASIAEQHHLNEAVFRIERIANGLDACEAARVAGTVERIEPVRGEALDAVRMSLDKLSAVAA